MIDYHTQERQEFLQYIQGKARPTEKQFFGDLLALGLGGLLLIVSLYL